MAHQTRARGSAKTNERFSSVSPNAIPRSMFDRSFSHKTTINSANLIPVYVDEVLPGDTMSLRPSFFARMATPLKPYMDGIHLDYQFFAIPLRLVWENFTKMMGEQVDPGDHLDYTIPQMVAPASIGHAVHSLSDYLTLPTDVPDYTHSCLFHRAYTLCWNTWYRDENLQDTHPFPMDDGPDVDTEYEVLKRGKRKDYISGALPFAQKGESVKLPLGDTAPLLGTAKVEAWSPARAPTFTPEFSNPTEGAIESTSGGSPPQATDFDGEGLGDLFWTDPALRANLTAGGGSGTIPLADLSNATSATVNELRQALGVQHLLEADARGGTRYVEHNLVHFGVAVPDLRLFRPELLATGSMPINASQVQNVGVTADLGELGAFAQASQVGRGFNKTFNEHMIVLGMVSVRAELSYQQGLHKMFSRKTRYEFFYPHLAHLGEQVVRSSEVYVDGTGDEDDETGDFSVWGYQPRYEEYRHRQSIISGQFRSTYSSSLDLWHLGLDFATRPVLNAAFIEEDPPISRIVADQSAPEFLLDCYYKIKHVRPMPKFATPGLLRF